MIETERGVNREVNASAPNRLRAAASPVRVGRWCAGQAPGMTSSSGSATGVGAVTSTNVGAFERAFGGCRVGRDFFVRGLSAGLSLHCSTPSRHFQYDSVEAFSPVSAANSFAVSPLSFQRSTRWPNLLGSLSP
ncbi:MAG: hypothetical protein OXT09_32060 [Myxococcales bacterium]|nr:hypothetical protein [Myxococcales bacterium]